MRALSPLASKPPLDHIPTHRSHILRCHTGVGWQGVNKRISEGHEHSVYSIQQLSLKKSSGDHSHKGVRPRPRLPIHDTVIAVISFTRNVTVLTNPASNCDVCDLGFFPKNKRMFSGLFANVIKNLEHKPARSQNHTAWLAQRTRRRRVTQNHLCIGEHSRCRGALPHQGALPTSQRRTWKFSLGNRTSISAPRHFLTQTPTERESFAVRKHRNQQEHEEA